MLCNNVDWSSDNSFFKTSRLLAVVPNQEDEPRMWNAHRNIGSLEIMNLHILSSVVPAVCEVFKLRKSKGVLILAWLQVQRLGLQFKSNHFYKSSDKILAVEREYLNYN